jgi:hypothetical protein
MLEMIMEEWSKWYSFEELYTFNGLSDRKSRSEFEVTLEGIEGRIAQANGFMQEKGTPIFIKRTFKEDRGEIPCGVYMLRIGGRLPEGDEKPPSGYYDYIGLAKGIMNPGIQRGFQERMFAHFRKLIHIPDRDAVQDALIAAYPDKDENQRMELLKGPHRNYDEFRDVFQGNYRNEEAFVTFFKNNKEHFSSTQDIKAFFKKHVRIRFNIFRRTLMKDGKRIPYFNLKELKKEILKGCEESLEKYEIYRDYEDIYSGKIVKAEGVCLQAYYTKFGDYPFLNQRNELTGVLGNFQELLSK